MKIAVFTDSFYPKIDGIAISSLETIKRLAEKGHKLKVFCPDNLGNNDEVRIKNTELHRIFSFPLLSYKEVVVAVPKKRRILKIVEGFNPDVLYLLSPGPIGITATYIKKKLKIPLVGAYTTVIAEQLMYLSPIRLLKLDAVKETLFKKHHFHKHKEETMLKKIVWGISLHIYKKCDFITVPSYPIKEELIKRKMEKPIQVISCGIDIKNIKKRSPLKKTGFSILHVGRLSHEKKIEIVIEAFSHLVKKYPQASLDIIGDGPARKSLEIFCSNLSLGNKVFFHGYVKHEKVLNMYRDYDLFVTASDMETLGLVVVEAMASGLPAIGVDKYALPSIIINGKNGLICKPNDVDCIAKSCEKILSDEILYRKFSRNSLRFAEEHGIGRVISKLEAVFLKLAKDKKNRLPGNTNMEFQIR
ncbi:glycosyltransferase [Candidatus Woesearchaeota archaeon]|nr:glycosyltransferase [Candidatus Woesearchaeota archaeon]